MKSTPIAPTVSELRLNQEHLQRLEQMLGEVPFKYAAPILAYLQNIHAQATADRRARLQSADAMGTSHAIGRNGLSESAVTGQD